MQSTKRKVCALGAALLLAGCAPSTGEDARPDIVLVMVDTLRPDHLGCYGHDAQTSPHIDELSREALLFENCLAHAPETRYSVASILSGFLPHETGVLDSLVLPAGVETLAETLGSHGYSTAAVIGNYVLRSGQGYEQGFEVYDDTMHERELVRRWPERIAEHTTNRAIELLEQSRDGPLFLWVVYQDPHGPYTPPDSFVRESDHAAPPRELAPSGSLSGWGGIPSYQQLGEDRDYYRYVARYDGEILYLDHHFKRLLDAMKELGLYDEALIVFTSDHGEGMGEHDYYFAHGESLYGDQIRVPLIIRHGNSLNGRRTDLVGQVDLVPTILGVAGIEADPRIRGRDLRSAHRESRTVLSEMRSPLVPDGVKLSVVQDGFKLIYTPLNRGFELFDLAADPGEDRDLILDAAYREQAERLKQSLDRIRREDRLGIEAPGPVELTDEEREKLESLGYVR